MWGQLGGAMQTTTETCETINAGKKNEKSPEEAAQERTERLIKGKTRQGYAEVDLKTNKPLKEASASEIDFIRLPENLRFFKPQNSMNAFMQKVIDAGDALFLRKRDGMMHALTVGEDGEPRLYSSNMLINHKDEPEIPWMDRYPHLYEEFKAMDLPPNTILLGEMCTMKASGEDFVDELGFAKDDFNYVGSIIKSLTPLALKKQEEKGRLGFCVWDIAFWDGNCWLKDVAAEERFDHIAQIISDAEAQWVSMPEMIMFDGKGGFVILSCGKEIMHLEFDDEPLKDITNWAKERGWEGYVVVDPVSVYDDRAFNFHGKAERPKNVVKLKPLFEADFIVRWDPENGIGKKGKGKKSGGIGSAQSYLYDPKTGEEKKICLVGGGLSDDLVHGLAKPELYPMVWQVEFTEWTAKGALRFPEFVRMRDDKALEECTVDQNPAWRGSDDHSE
jgi:hypothetical protein